MFNLNLIGLCIFFSIATPLFADTVYLKNGDKLESVEVEERSDGYWVAGALFNKDEIKRIAKDQDDLVLDLNNGTLGGLQVGQMVGISVIESVMKQKPDDKQYGCYFYHRGVEICNWDGINYSNSALEALSIHHQRVVMSGFEYRKFAGKINPDLMDKENKYSIKEKFGEPEQENGFGWFIYNKPYGKLTFKFNDDGTMDVIELDSTNSRYLLTNPTKHTVDLPTVPPEHSIAVDTSTIIASAHVSVQKHLKSPSSARFPYGEEDHQVQNLGNNKWSVSSFVDSQNSFGAQIRSFYTVVMQFTSDDEWGLVDLKVNEQ